MRLFLKGTVTLKGKIRLVAMLALALCFVLTSCSIGPNTKMILGETFVEEAESAGFTVSDMMTEEYEEDYYNLYEAVTEEIYIQYFFAKDEMVANYLYTNDYNKFIEMKGDNVNAEETTTSNFTKIALTMEDGRRIVAVRSGGTYMYLEASATGRASLDNFLDKISY